MRPAGSKFILEFSYVSSLGVSFFFFGGGGGGGAVLLHCSADVFCVCEVAWSCWLADSCYPCRAQVPFEVGSICGQGVWRV